MVEIIISAFLKEQKPHAVSQYNLYSTKTRILFPVCYDSPRHFNVRHEVSNNLDNGEMVFQD